jgi:hypothetical protein
MRAPEKRGSAASAWLATQTTASENARRFIFVPARATHLVVNGTISLVATRIFGNSDPTAPHGIAIEVSDLIF